MLYWRSRKSNRTKLTCVDDVQPMLFCSLLTNFTLLRLWSTVSVDCWDYVLGMFSLLLTTPTVLSLCDLPRCSSTATIAQAFFVLSWSCLHSDERTSFIDNDHNKKFEHAPQGSSELIAIVAIDSFPTDVVVEPLLLKQKSRDFVLIIYWTPRAPT